MHAVFKVYDALKRNGMDDNDARLLSESIGEGRRGERFDKIEHTLARHGERFDKIEHTLARHGERFDKIEHTLAQHGERFDKVDERLDALESRMRDVEADIRVLAGRLTTQSWVVGILAAANLAVLVHAVFQS